MGGGWKATWVKRPKLSEKRTRMRFSCLRISFEIPIEMWPHGLISTPQNCPKHPSNCTPDWVEKDVNRGVSYYCLDLDDKTIGCAAFEKASPEEGYLERLAVLPEYRYRGLGKALIRHVFDVARTTGIRRMGIGIISEQQDLKQWYERMGFVEQEIKTFSTPAVQGFVDGIYFLKD